LRRRDTLWAVLPLLDGPLKLRLGLVIAVVAVAGCAAAEEPRGDPTVLQVASHMVIIGVDANHTVITEPLIEVIPPAGTDDAELQISFAQVGPPIMLGIEGALGFLRAHAADGSIVLDRIVELTKDKVAVPPGDYTLLVYYRTCSGYCGVLDPEQEFCSVVADLERGERYQLEVTVTDPQHAVCALTPAE
jgi:hypothetical protein